MSQSSAAPVVSTYRTRPAWLAAMGAATGLATGNPAFRGLLTVATHLAWRGPSSSVAWHKGTNANVVSVANANGAKVGTPVSAAMASVLKAASAAATTAPQRTAVAALVKASA